MALSLVVGVVAGLFIGPLFVPDPTGVLSAVLTLVVAGAVSAGLYLSGWDSES